MYVDSFHKFAEIEHFPMKSMHLIAIRNQHHNPNHTHYIWVNLKPLQCYQQGKLEQHLSLQEIDLQTHSHDILQHLVLHATNQNIILFL